MTSDELLIMAEQQILGFTSALRGDDIVSLVGAMGLTCDEWAGLRVEVSAYMHKENVEALDEHFAR